MSRTRVASALGPILLLLLSSACGETSRAQGAGGTGNTAGVPSGGTSVGGSGVGGSSGGASGSIAAGGSNTGAGGGASGAGGSATGGTSGASDCVIGSPCDEIGSSCTEDVCCPCLLECRANVWEAAACPGCVVPCPSEPPSPGEQCNDCAGTSVCQWDDCSAASPGTRTEATCDNGAWSVEQFDCGGVGCGCISDAGCAPGWLCVRTQCKAPVPGGCWRDDECEPDTFCAGDFICACNERCAFRDRHGACVPDDGTCCDTNEDCADSAQCVSGVCKDSPQEPGGCWSDSDCDSGTCEGAQVCACGMACLVADSEGSCP